MQNIAFTHANVFDGRMEGELQEDATILVKVERRGEVTDGTIMEIGPTIETAIPPEYRVVDLSGKHVIPGLINAHVHLFSDGRPRAAASASESVLKLFVKLINSRLGRLVVKSNMRKNAQNALNSGVTTLRSVGDFNYFDVELRDEFEAGKSLGPRLLVAGKGICVTGGHGWYFSYVADNPWEGRKAVRKIL